MDVNATGGDVPRRFNEFPHVETISDGAIPRRGFCIADNFEPDERTQSNHAV